VFTNHDSRGHSCARAAADILMPLTNGSSTLHYRRRSIQDELVGSISSLRVKSSSRSEVLNIGDEYQQTENASVTAAQTSDAL